MTSLRSKFYYLICVNNLIVIFSSEFIHNINMVLCCLFKKNCEVWIIWRQFWLSIRQFMFLIRDVIHCSTNYGQNILCSLIMLGYTAVHLHLIRWFYQKNLGISNEVCNHFWYFLFVSKQGERVWWILRELRKSI